MIQIQDIEFKIINKALTCGGHTDVYLLPKHFINKHLSKIWEEIKDVEDINVLDMTKRHDENFLSDIIAHVTSYEITVKQAADLMVEDYNKREFLQAIETARSLVENGTSPEIAMSKLSEIETTNTSTNEPESAVRVMMRVYKDVEAVSTGEKESATFIPTGLPAFDAMFYGIERSAYTVVAARSSMGKSAFSMNMSINASLKGYDVLVISLEMSKESLVYRIYSSMAKLDLQLLRKGVVKNETTWQKMADANQKMCNEKLYLDDSPSLTLHQLLSKVRQHNKKRGLDMVVIDYMGLMSTDNKNQKKHEYISDISNAMPAIAKELNIAVVALAQIGRDVEKRPNKRPLMSDLRDSGSLEQDSDAIIMLYRDEYYNKKKSNEGMAEIIMQKNRNGPVGTVLASFDKEFASFGEVDDAKVFDYVNAK